MSLIRKSDLDKYPIVQKFWKSSKMILKEESESFSDEEEYDIFLSHKYSDADYILKFKMFLEKQGFKVYVDWVEDTQLSRDDINSETADTIRYRMKSCKCLLYVYTEDSNHSKWMPWELGYFDGYKKKVAVVPIYNDIIERYYGQEYLSLYPYLTKSGDSLWIYTQDDSASAEFNHWINNNVWGG